MLVMWGDGEGKTGDRKDGSDVDLQIFSDGSSRVVVHLPTTQTYLEVHRRLSQLSLEWQLVALGSQQKLLCSHLPGLGSR